MVAFAILLDLAVVRDGRGDGHVVAPARRAERSACSRSRSSRSGRRFHGMSGGKLPCPEYVQDHVELQLVAGLDLRGGLRLVYTVDVEEAIKDKRDHYYEDMRLELTRKSSACMKEDERADRRGVQEAREKVELEAPRTTAQHHHAPSEAGRRSDARSTSASSSASAPSFRTRAARTGASYDFRIRTSVESSIRERAVGQAREIIGRRVDELGLREAAVSTRDEDIIIEVPGEDEKSFATIRDIISQTARLEFKLLDDDTDFFKDVARKASAESAARGTRVQPGARRRSARTPTATSVTRRSPTPCLKKQRERDDPAGARSASRSGSRRSTCRPIARSASSSSTEPSTRSRCKQEEVGWRTYFLKSRAEITGDMIRDAARTARAERRARSAAGTSRSTFTDQGGKIFERITGDNIKRRFAIILDGTVESAPVIQSAIPGGHASDHARLERPRGAAARRAKARAGAALRRAAGADLALERAAHRPVARARRDRARRAGRARRQRARARLHGRLLQPRRAHRRHRGALEPVPAARDPGLVRRLDDAARHRRPRAHHRHERGRQRAHQRAHPRRARRSARRRAPRSKSATSAPSAPSSTATSRRSSPASSSRSTARARSRASPSTLHRRHRLQPLHGRRRDARDVRPLGTRLGRQGRLALG